MYQARGSNGLGFSLKPPDWLRAFVARTASAALQGTRVRVQSPAGSVDFDLSNPADLKALKDMAQSARISRAPAPGPLSPIHDSVAKVPGGWLTILGLGAVAWFAMSRRRRAF